MASNLQEFSKGVVRENPIFGLMLGLCPTLAVTVSVKNGFYMSLAVTFVLLGSNVIVSLVRNLIPKEIRIPCFIVIIATFVSMVDLLMNAYAPPAVVESLSIFIPLIVVNCIILGRAEAFASKNGVFRSVLDALGMSLGFFLALSVICAIREFGGSGEIFGYQVFACYGSEAPILPVGVLGMAPGAFIVIGLLFALKRLMEIRAEEKTRVCPLAPVPALKPATEEV